MIRGFMWSALAALLLVAGCAGRPFADLPTAGSQLPSGSFLISGRAAFVNREQSGQLGFAWFQHGDELRMVLTVPVSQSRYRVEARPGVARIQGPLGSRRADSLTALLEDQLGVAFPEQLLVAWIRGIPAGETAHVSYASDGRPASIRESGWTVDYRRWAAPAPAVVPRRIDARSAGVELRLVIDQADFGR